MAASSFGSHDHPEDHTPQDVVPAACDCSDAGALVAAASQFHESLSVLEKRLADSLARRTMPPVDAPIDLTPLITRLDRIESAMAMLSNDSMHAAVSAMGDELRAMEKQHFAELAAITEKMQVIVRDGLEQQSHVPQAVVERHPARNAAEETGGWELAVFGSSLSAQSELAGPRRQLLTGVLAGEPASCGLAGILLIFQSVTSERLPQMLKDVGEAYYRWRPKTSAGTDPFEDSLARWLQDTCEEAGIPNTIELVHPGERFDASRHSAISRGVEISEVHGWIVLRDNGRVYSKANVSVR